MLGAMYAEANKQVVRRFVDEHRTAANEQSFAGLVHPEVVDRSRPPGIAEGVTRKVFHGTHRGELMGIAPTGRAVQIEVIDIVRVRDGQIVDHWNVVDRLGLLQQLGALT
jgi:predicted ester cyclase